MPRMLGVDIPANKKIEFSLQYIYGIGPYRAKVILSELNIDPNVRAKELHDDDIARIVNLIQTKYKVEGELRRDLTQSIRRLVDIHSYRGIRHRKGLPVRGQRTRTNCRTRKGPKARVGMKRK